MRWEISSVCAGSSESLTDASSALIEAIWACSVFLKEAGSGMFAMMAMVEFVRKWYAETWQEIGKKI